MPSSIKKILVLRFSSIGDIVLTSPVLRCVKEQLKSEIHFVTKAKFKQVVEHNPRIDRLYMFSKEITEILPQLKKENYDLILDLHKNLRSKRLIASLGVRSLSFNKINVEKWLRVHTRLNFLPNKHLVDRYFESLAPMGVQNDGYGLEYFHGLTTSEISSICPNRPYVSIVLGATYYTKRIPLLKIQFIIENSNLPVVLLGGIDVSNVGAELERIYGDRVMNHTAQLSLNESAAIIANSHYVISGDTGLMHIAAAFNVPMMVFWGSTAYELGMYPYYGINHDIHTIHLANDAISCSPCSKIGKKRCPKGHFKCMLDLKEEKILDGMRELEV